MTKHPNQKSLYINYSKKYQCKECGEWFRLKGTLNSHNHGHCRGFRLSRPINDSRASGKYSNEVHDVN